MTDYEPAERRKQHAPTAEEIRKLARFVSEKEKQGVVSAQEGAEIFFHLIKPLLQQGYLKPADVLDNLEAAPAVLRTAGHLMKKKLFDLHPELAEELKEYLAAGPPSAQR